MKKICLPYKNKTDKIWQSGIYGHIQYSDILMDEWEKKITKKTLFWFSIYPQYYYQSRLIVQKDMCHARVYREIQILTHTHTNVVVQQFIQTNVHICSDILLNGYNREK